MDNLARITADIEIAKLSQQHLVAVFIDVSSAYDNVLRNILVNILKEENCPYKIRRYVNQWMKERRTKFIINQDTTIERTVDRGLPQGGVISPTLYALYTKNITNEICQQVKVLQYADDIALYSVDTDTEEVSQRIEAAIRRIDGNLKQLDLEIEPGKTQVVKFQKPNSNRNRGNKISIRINEHEIEEQDRAKFLGVVLDQELNFQDQVDNVKNKTGKALNLLSYLNRVLWGMEIKSAIHVYNSYVRSIIDYSLFIYYPKDWKGRDKLEKIQNRGLRVAMGYRNSTPINVMTLESGNLKLEDRAGLLARNFWIKIIYITTKKI